MNKKYESIYIVQRLQDLNEGRGPYVMEGGGYFIDENEAWAYADTLTGVQGRKPGSGSWRSTKYADVTVKQIPKHDPVKYKRKAELESKIKQAQNELYELQREMRSNYGE